MKFTNYNFKIGWCFGLHTTAIREIGIKPEEGFVFVQYVLGLPNFLGTLQKQNRTKNKPTSNKNREYTKIRTFYRWYIVYVFKYIDLQIGYNVNLLNLFFKMPRSNFEHFHFSEPYFAFWHQLMSEWISFMCRAIDVLYDKDNIVSVEFGLCSRLGVSWLLLSVVISSCSWFNYANNHLTAAWTVRETGQSCLQSWSILYNNSRVSIGLKHRDIDD